jgi:hypothetical protein
VHIGNRSIRAGEYFVTVSALAGSQASDSLEITRGGSNIAEGSDALRGEASNALRGAIFSLIGGAILALVGEGVVASVGGAVFSLVGAGVFE